jgi:hypothetical protein
MISDFFFGPGKAAATGGGRGKENARLVEVTLYPVAGDAAGFSVDSRGTSTYSSAHSRM